jgi:hypothetical protein
MKHLEDLINVEKARLLHELFPQEIPTLLEYQQHVPYHTGGRTVIAHSME